MNGAALIEGVTVLFLAQAALLVVCVITAVGAAGTPSSSLPLLVVILQSLGLPGEGIAIILGVDRFLDMCRTTLNVAGDVSAAVVIARSEGLALHPQEDGEFAPPVR